MKVDGMTGFSDSGLIAAQAESSGNYVLVYVMFLVAGLLVGGAWSMYKNGSIILAAVFVGCAAVAAIAGILWMIGELGG